ncbi:hypothetical protein ACT7DH_26405 [Bacillus pacificus]
MKKSKKMLAGATLAIGVIAPQVLPATAHADEQTGESTHAHQLKNENKMNFRSNKLKNT